MARDRKKTHDLGATLIFLDETGFLTQPYGDQTWALIGQTPIVKHRLRHRERVTVLGSLCVSPGHRRVDLLTAFFPGRSLVQEDLIDHFQKLRRRFRRPLVVV
ncbi:MAG: hypothetical protein ACRCZF_24350, partial [Gemmataceae bacterium]